MGEITCKGCGRAMDSELKCCPGCGRRVEAAAAPLPLIDDEVAGTAAPEVEELAGAAPSVERAEVEAPESESEGGAASPGDEAEDEEEEEEEPRGDTVQMSLSDATKVWIEESGIGESGSASGTAKKSRLPLLVGLFVLAAAVLAVILLVL